MPSFLSNSHPLVFAHRGGCALGPENTIAAFDLGRAAGADGLELDVHRSSDGVVVVLQHASEDAANANADALREVLENDGDETFTDADVDVRDTLVIAHLATERRGIWTHTTAIPGTLLVTSGS